MNIDNLLQLAFEQRASDLHLTVGISPMIRVDGKIISLPEQPKLLVAQTEQLVYSMLEEKQKKVLQEKGELDFSYSIPKLGRFRVNAFRQRGSIAAVIRLIPTESKTLLELGMPSAVKELASKPRGLVLITGPTGSGKSTTLAAMIDLINREEHYHIITLEDPIEYLHSHKKKHCQSKRNWY